MIAPSGGFCPTGSSGGSGVSVFLFQRTRHARCGLNSVRLGDGVRESGAAARCRRGSRSRGRACATTRSSSWTTRSRIDDRRHVQPQRLPVVAVVERERRPASRCRRRAARDVFGSSRTTLIVRAVGDAADDVLSTSCRRRACGRCADAGRRGGSVLIAAYAVVRVEVRRLEHRHLRPRLSAPAA